MLPPIAQRGANKEAAMPKPYSILAAALVASGRSLSTATVAGPIDRHDARPSDESEDRFTDPRRSSSFSFESPFATNPFVLGVPVNAAPSSA
jgi:hypothetical protein